MFVCDCPESKELYLVVNRLFPCVRRISQDLAKDLAVLAREIHDVAGEIDSVSSSGTAPSTTVSTAATTPGSAIDTREEVGPARAVQPDIQESMKKVPDFSSSITASLLHLIIPPTPLLEKFYLLRELFIHYIWYAFIF